MSGKLVVLEGVNGAGKTSILEAAIPELECAGFVYSKGFTNNTPWDSLINTHPHSLTYYVDLAYKTHRQIKPTLAKGKDVLQDRYVQTVDSFLPDSGWVHNQMIRRLFNPFFLVPDLYVHVTASVDEVVSRLAGDACDAYRLGLVQHPERIEQREVKYRELFDRLDCNKHVLDTTGRVAEDCAQELIHVIRRELKCL